MKPFQPKLGPARPRVTAAMQAAALQQFQPQPDADGKPPAKKKKAVGKNAISMALQGAF